MGRFGPEVKRILGTGNVFDIPIAGNVTVYSEAIKLNNATNFAIAYKASVTAGAPDLAITIEQCYRAPTTEYAADSDYVAPTGISGIETSLTGVTRKIVSISPVAMPYVRFKIAGAAGNHASTTLDLRISTQEDF